MNPEQINIDLHLHTRISDGTDTPAELLAQVKAAGIDLFSVTDHDAVKGAELLRGLLTEGDPRFLPGVEFSCRDKLGKYHILGYGYDPKSPSIQGIVDLGHALRMEKVQARLDYIASEFGFTFSKEDLAALLAQDNPGKPHIGNLMVRYGYAETKEQAIRQYLDRLHLRDGYVAPDQAIEGILGAGGVPVLAHPCFGSGDQLILGQELEDRVRRLMDFGLRGLEGFYSGFTDKLRAEVLALAERYDLYLTAGSDYHGKNKLVVLGDTGLARGETRPAGLLRFLREVALC